MTQDQAKAINNKRNQLIAERAICHKIVVFDEVVNGDRSLLSADALVAYEQDEIGQAYFDYIESARARRDEITVELNALPKIPMGLVLQMRAG